MWVEGIGGRRMEGWGRGLMGRMDGGGGRGEGLVCGVVGWE